MRVDSSELPLSAIPLCQLLPSHLGPPRPTLSINLYVKGCLDCTVGAFHMSIPVEPSLFQYEIQVFNYEPCKYLNGPDGGSVLWFNIADLSDHCSVISLQTLEAWLCHTGLMANDIRIPFDLDKQIYPVYTAARSWVSALYSYLSNPHIPYFTANSMFRKSYVFYTFY